MKRIEIIEIAWIFYAVWYFRWTKILHIECLYTSTQHTHTQNLYTHNNDSSLFAAKVQIKRHLLWQLASPSIR